MTAPRVLLVDHRDSFVHVLADQFARLGADVDVVAAAMPLAAFGRCLRRERPTLVVLSPGPGHPADARLALAWLRTAPRVPVLGVCLGHQVLGLAAGAEVVRGHEPVHGEACEVTWHAAPRGVSTDALPRHMPAARYHSLVVARPKVDVPLRVLATAPGRGGGAGDVVMAIEHTELPQLGVQFHPESVLTPHGRALLRLVLDRARAAAAEPLSLHGTEVNE